MSSRWVLPLDPSCPEVAEYEEGLYGDPMGRAMGAPLGEIFAAWSAKHRSDCERCQEFGAANIDVAYDGSEFHNDTLIFLPQHEAEAILEMLTGKLAEKVKAQLKDRLQQDLWQRFGTSNVTKLYESFAAFEVRTTDGSVIRYDADANVIGVQS